MVSFRTASADAVAALTDQVGGVAEASAATVAGDLFAAAAAVRGEASLRRVITDPSVPAQARASLVGDLFQGKVDGISLDLLRDAAGRRWSRPRDFADALEQLGVVAAVRSTGTQGETLVDQAVRRTPPGDGEQRPAQRAVRPGPLGRRQGLARRVPARRQGTPGHGAGWSSRRCPGRTGPWSPRSRTTSAPPRRCRGRAWPRSTSPVRCPRPTRSGSPPH
ncbi:hypothetical protein [Nocardioides convexus]|uniref:hypothetical protein n=1 Tax=Nocardioides convexus TaxID=2712224 RepID=UPI0024186090|nr:hypothetical protein [Nocardioides convexus]